MREQNATLSHRLRLIRAVLGISELDAAAAAGVSRQTWRRWEISGRSGEGIVDFIYAYGLSFDLVLRGDAAGLKRFPIRSSSNVTVLTVANRKV
jgi:transcriptional regulator with XRE-family HTH domain